jgi:hypothetical protein
MSAEISQPNNATRTPTAELRFGIRISAPAQDPFNRLVGDDWHSLRWFATREERDAVMRDMGGRHRYSRSGDLPSVVLEPVER